MRPSWLWLGVVSLGITAGQLAARLPLLSTRRFDPDEFEHAHMAWYILQGEVPFRDFFEHHPPLFHYLLAGFFSAFDIERSPDHAMQALFGARMAGWVMSAFVIAATGVLAWRLRDAMTAWVTLPLVSGGIVIALRAIEIRPDGLSTLFWIGSLVLLHAGLTSDRPVSSRTRTLFALSGTLIGLAVLASQKLLMAGPPLALLMVWHLADSRFGTAMRDRLITAAWQAAGVFVPWSLAIVWFIAHDAAGEFIRLTLLDSLQWTQETSARSILTFLMRYEPWLFGLAAGGAVLLVQECRRRDRRLVGSIVLLVAAAGMFTGLFLLPVPYAQYGLTFMPLFAILAAAFLVESTRSLASAASLGSVLRPLPGRLLVAAPVVVLSVVGLGIAKPIIVAGFVYPLMAAGAVVAVLALPYHRRCSAALAVVLLVLAVFPAQWNRWMADLGDQGQFAELRYVLDRTAPDDVVLDGWTGYGVFRRHAGYYWMFHPGVRAMLPAATVDGMVEDLRTGRIRPALVILDDYLRQLSTDLAAFVEAHYETVDVGDIRVARRSPPRDLP